MKAVDLHDVAGKSIKSWVDQLLELDNEKTRIPFVEMRRGYETS